MNGRMKRVRLVIVLVVGVLVGSASISRGQVANPTGSRRSVEVKAVGGYGGFIDEEMIDHGVVGGAVRVPLTERLGLEGEVLYLRGPDGDHDWLVMPSVAFDLRRGGTVVPYLVGGVGWLRTTMQVGTGPYTSNSWTGSGGAGVRLNLGQGAFVAFEGRLGSEPLTRATVAFGWRLPMSSR